MNPTRGPRERFRHPSTRQLMSSARRGRGDFAGRRTIRCAGIAVGSLPSAASLRLRSRMLFCSAAESLPAWALQNQRLRGRSEEHTSELQSHSDLVCRLLLEKKKENPSAAATTTLLPGIAP